MSALLQICRTRTAVAVLGSGVVISLTALTGGISPALAAPHTDPVTPTTTSVEAPALEGAQAPEETEAREETQAPKVTEVPEETVAPEATEAPEVPTPDTTPVETTAVETSAPTVVESPTQTRVADPETTTEAPVTAKAPPARTRAPQTEPAPPAVPDAPTDASTEDKIATTTPTPDLVAPATTTSAVPVADSPPGESQSPQTETAAPDAEVTASSSSVVTQAALAIQPLKPQTLKAAPADVEMAKSAPPVEQQPAPAPEQDVAVLASAIKLGDNRSGPAEVVRRDSVVVPARDDRVWDRKVRQWDPDWVRYDEYYRPILSNPYRDPVRIVYVYQNARRIAIIPALASIVLDVVRLAAYSFTAVLLSPLNAVLDVAVGSFFGGGYIPAVGLPLPPPPPPVLRYDNVPVQVRYSDAVYQPFRVQRIVDVGDDARYGERKVLLDGTTPAWGTWTQTPSGERLFEVHKTQQYPGLDDPREVPLPGDYQLRLAADDVSTAPGHRTAYLMAAALTCAGLSVSAVIGSVLLGRRRRSEL